MKTVRLTLRCDEIIKRKQDWNREFLFVFEARFTVVYGKSKMEKNFIQGSPFGSLTFGYYKEDLFEPGKEYSVYITGKAEEE